MDDAVCVCHGERRGDLTENAPCFVHGERTFFFYAVGDALPADVLHHEVRRPVVQLADAEDGHDVRMGQARHSLRFLFEAGPLFRVGCQRRRQHLDRHRPLEHGIPREKDAAHAAHADTPYQEEVRAQRRAQLLLELPLGPRGRGRIIHRERRAGADR
ncbi:MAG TPA: hypothetical protein VJ992_11940 [Gemmatimonadales bacterium]|nr:hypothetical protein [Gemmatimonadales bacterium]